MFLPRGSGHGPSLTNYITEKHGGDDTAPMAEEEIAAADAVCFCFYLRQNIFASLEQIS